MAKKSNPVKPPIPKNKPVGVKEYKYVRVSEKAGQEKFKEMGERILNKELVWGYFAIDGNVSYHYYRILK